MGQCGTLLVENELSALARCRDVVLAHPELHLLAAVDSYEAGLQYLRAHGDEVELLLTDLQLGDGDGTDLITTFRKLPPSLQAKTRKALVVSVFGDVTSVVRAVEAGADGYLLKGGTDEEMHDTLTIVLQGGAPISAAVAGHLLRRIRDEADTPEASRQSDSSGLAALSERETDVLRLLARGQSYKEAARDLGLSPYTVGDHVKKIYQKLAVTSRGEAVFTAIKGGLIDVHGE